MRGRKPIPTDVKIRNGNPGNRALNTNEPRPGKLTELGEPPEWMGTYGKAEWNRVGPVLISLGLLTEADLMVFSAYVMNVDLLINAQIAIERDGMTIAGGRDGTREVRNPALAAFASATTAIRAFASEFGMSASARSRIHLPGDDDDVSLEDLLGGPADDDIVQ